MTISASGASGTIGAGRGHRQDKSCPRPGQIVSGHGGQEERKAPVRLPWPALWGGSGSGGGGLAAGPGAGAGGQGDPELGELGHVEAGFVGSAKLVAGDGPPVGLGGQALYSI